MANSFTNIVLFFFPRSAVVSEVSPELGEDAPWQVRVPGEQQRGGAVWGRPPERWCFQGQVRLRDGESSEIHELAEETLHSIESLVV